MEDTLLDLPQPFTEGLRERDASSSTPTTRMRNFPRLPPMRGKILWQKSTKYKKGIIGSQPRGNHNVFTHIPKDPNCEVCKKTKSTRARCRIKPEKRVDGIALSTKFGDLITADYKSRNVENESRCRHRNNLIVQDGFTNWSRRRRKHWRQCRVHKDFFLRRRSRKEFTQTIPNIF